MLLAFTLATFLSAALLFAVQPMIAKVLLPLLGGSPAVWNTCMLFFQAALLLGYLYAHGLARLRSLRLQVGVHAAVLGIAILLLPVGLPEGWTPPRTSLPVGWVLMALFASVGVPFFALASAAPLLQSWFSRTGHRAASDPYFLYAASNTGSLLALLGYPLLMEPALGVGAQAETWSWGYGVFALMALGCGALAARGAASGGVAAAVDVPESDNAPTWRTRLLWVALAFAPSSLMLGVTHHLATDVASFPLLWVVPLSLYLVTFIIAFARWGPLFTRGARILLPVVAVGLAIMLAARVRSWIAPQLWVHLTGLLVLAMACHGTLAARRPSASRLTEFYLLVSVGGVLGGIFNALIAPVVFDSIAEYPAAIAACCLVVACSSTRRLRWREGLWGFDLVAVVLVVAVFLRADVLAEQIDAWSSDMLSDDDLWGVSRNRWLVAALPAVACLVFVWRAPGFAVGIATLLALVHTRASDDVLLWQERTFFGVYRVYEESLGDDRGFVRSLDHGTTTHGLQYDGPLSRLPTTYYAPSGPVGDIVDVINEPGGPRRVAVVGLGCGTFAAHGSPDWKLTFFEIDPAVVSIATDTTLFTYVAESDAEVDFVVGDARLRIGEAEDGTYDAIVLDAYASDAIPIHLITREAVALYLRKLAPGGMLVFHVTNLHLDLEVVVSAITADLGLVAAIREDDDDDDSFEYGSDWIAAARSKVDLGAIEPNATWRWLAPEPGFPVWTDDRHDLLRVIEEF